MSNEDQLDQFVSLWNLVQNVTMTNESDAIEWRITADRKYSASSAYTVQFLGRVKRPLLAKVWYIRAVGKVKFFWWLVLQNRIWTAERLRARGLPHNSECCLCDHVFETADHLALQCLFAKVVWAQLLGSYPHAV